MMEGASGEWRGGGGGVFGSLFEGEGGREERDGQFQALLSMLNS